VRLKADLLVRHLTRRASAGILRSVVDDSVDSVQLFQGSPMMEPKPKDAFNAQAFLKSPGIGREIVAYRRGKVIFTQGVRRSCTSKAAA